MIGTNSPAAKLEISNSGTTVLRVLAGTGNGVDDDNLLRLMPQNGTGEGGHLEFKGSGSYQDWTVDTISGELRFFELINQELQLRLAVALILWLILR